MASSSSSFHSAPPTSWKYDVFLSFRGIDTRYTFVDHLYSALVQQGIGTFKDDEELPRGETIHPSLLKAIEDSQIAIVVFSENYAHSSWCLQELEHIMKCKVERDQIVIPIFYHVDPSEIRNQKRKYGEAFSKHESEKKNVESWRKVVMEAGHLSGYVANGPETIFIKNIVKEILERLCIAIPSDNENLIGMEDRLQDLKSKLAVDSQGVLMVGIWGLGGGGKTTLARVVYDQISSNFDGCSFMNNIREESRKHGLKELQKEILSCVLKQKREEAVGDVRTLITTKLRRKKVLMVLDDVDNVDQLEALAGSRDWFKEGSRIIITTRNQHLLNTHGVNMIYKISLLNDEEAMKLFSKHTLRHGNHIEDYDSLSKDVVSYACGLPLALKVMGSFLCDKDRSEWVSALARLKDIPDGKIVEQLKISYDGLEPLVKELFLEIACFFRGEWKDKTTVILKACGLHPDIGVKELIQKALITVTEKGIFDMHDLIQEMGHHVVREKYPRNPEKHSRIWRWEDVVTICALPEEARTENHWIEALKVRCEFLCSFPRVVANMKELRWISCFLYPATSLPRNFQPTKLSYLLLCSDSLKQLWEGEKHLPNLKVLDLGGCSNLVRTPDFHGLPCLERLKLNYCLKLTDVHPSIGYHERLISVEMPSCMSLEMFPPIKGMKKLETLDLSWCSKLRKFPKIQMNMDNMKELSLDRTGIKVVPSSIVKYCTNLRSLDLRYCESLESIEELPDLPSSIAVLQAYQCDKLKIDDLPTDLKWLWRISLPLKSILGDVDRKVQSMLQGNAIKDNSIILCFDVDNIPTRGFARRRLMLELPRNWYNEFSGFLICINVGGIFSSKYDEITIEDVMGRENEDVLEVSDGTPKEAWDNRCMCYIYMYPLVH
ncbi:TMV resistance protein N-like [Cynara cardunculus var. scolymus]|uniref:TMV resistance protein N-like n=1 Tax=Cynara cardunculus var. scolymus TaxID=59895 RepID=UPI000D626564|nr:TMV resistance protein N-like [Cynara cardunculus var. scolymus]